MSLLKSSLFFCAFFLLNTWLSAQVDSTDLVLSFRADCVNELTTDDKLYAFDLLKLEKLKEKVQIEFMLNVNCAKNKQGMVEVVGDTLKISNTDAVVTQKEYSYDSLGKTYSVVEETSISNYSFCDCEFKYQYELATSVDLHFLKFDDYLYPLKD